MFSFIGRGICKFSISQQESLKKTILTTNVVYIFVGSVLLGPKWPGFASGAVVGAVGIGYAILEFIPQIEPPANMREAEAGWGAEQV